jgi:WD40 repeat protein
MLDSITRTLEKNSQISRIRKLTFCACHNRWSKDAQNMSAQEFQSCLETLYDRHATIVEFKHALYQIVIKLNHSSEYYSIANSICTEIEKAYDAPSPRVANASASKLAPSAIETQSLHIVHLQIQAITIPMQVLCEVTINGQRQLQRVIELPTAFATEYQNWQTNYRQVPGQSLIDRATGPELDRVNRSWDSTSSLLAMLQRWYQSDQWETLRRQLQSFVPGDAPLQIVVSGNDLPHWQLQWSDFSQAVQLQPAVINLAARPATTESVNVNKSTEDPALQAIRTSADQSGIKPAEQDPELVLAELLESISSSTSEVNQSASFGDEATGEIGDDLQPPTISSAIAVPIVLEYDTLTLEKQLTGYHSEVHALAINSRRGIIVSGHGDIGYKDNNLKVWRTDDGEQIRDLAGHSNWIQTLVLTEDGMGAYSSGLDKQILAWNLATGEKLPFQINAENAVTSLLLAKQERHLIAGTSDGQIKIWDSHSGDLLTSWFAHEGGVHGLAATDSFAGTGGDRLLVSAGEDGIARLWDGLNGSGIRQFVGHGGRVTRVAIDPTGERVITAGVDRTVRIWEAATGNLLHTLVGHERAVNCMILTPDGRSIISGSDDKTIKIWQLQNGRLINNLYGHNTPVLSVAVGGNTLVSGGYGEMRIWEIA